MEVKEPPSKPKVTLQMRMRKSCSTFQCKDCGKCFTRSWALVQHLWTHSEEKPVKCKLCAKSFNSMVNLKKHHNMKHKINVGNDKELMDVTLMKLETRKKEMANGSGPARDEASSDEASSDEASSDEASSDEASSDEASSDEASSDEASSEQASSEQASSEQASSEQASSEQASSKKAASKKAKSKPEESVTDQLLALEPRRNVVPNDKRSCVCDKCGRRFTDKARLMTHQRFHEGKTIHRCVYCGSEFMSSEQLKVHERVHTGEKPYKCDYCPKIFYVLAKLYAHTRKYHSDVVQSSQTRLRSFMCYECKEDFPTKRDLIEHHDMKHKKERYQCKYCQKKFLYKRFLRIHERTHYLEGYNSQSEELVERNELTDLIISKKLELTCENCVKIFPNKTQLQIHQLTHIGKEGFKCQYCSMDFFNIDILRMHERSHTGEQPYKCDYCGRWFGLLGNLWGHIRTQHPNKELPKKETFDYLNTIHPQFSSQPPSLPSKPSPQTSAKPSSRPSPQPSPQPSPPLVMKVTSDKPFVCDYCNKAFKSKYHLIEHRFIHTGKPLTCEICGQGYIRQSKLEAHQKTHTGNDVFTCDECGYKFPSLAKLGSHKLKKHIDASLADKETHKCKYCDLVFVHQGSLNIHMQCHIEAQPDCETSGQSEGNSDSSSLERRGAEQEFTCKDCGTVVKLGCTTMSNVFAVADFSNVKCFLNNHRMI